MDDTTHISTCCIHQDVSDSRSDKLVPLTNIHFVQLLFVNEEEVLQEKRLNCGQNSTWSTFLLEDRVMHLFIKEEALSPGRMEAAFIALKQ